jgi:hypothetical protein
MLQMASGEGAQLNGFGHCIPKEWGAGPRYELKVVLRQMYASLYFVRTCRL